ncbi:MAG: hypothetical protein ACE15F_10050 [bacterium]
MANHKKNGNKSLARVIWLLGFGLVLMLMSRHGLAEPPADPNPLVMGNLPAGKVLVITYKVQIH